MIVDPNKIDFGAYLDEISFLEAQSLKPATDFADRLRKYALTGKEVSGPTLPWSTTHDFTRINEGKLSIWAGVNGSGKSQLLGQVINGLMLQGRKACVASMEMLPEETLHRMVSQSAGCDASGAYGDGWLGYFYDKLYVYDQLDRVAADKVLGMVCYAANELKTVDIVIDSLTKCGVGRDDYAEQAKFVDRLQWCCKRYRVHIHLVCHMRKGNGDRQEGKNDIRGAAEITDLADNVFILRRNTDKEEHTEMRDAGKNCDPDVLLQPCAWLKLEKNRQYGLQTQFNLWFDRLSGQFTERDGGRYPHLEVGSGS